MHSIEKDKTSSSVWHRMGMSLCIWLFLRCVFHQPYVWMSSQHRSASSANILRTEDAGVVQPCLLNPVRVHQASSQRDHPSVHSVRQRDYENSVRVVIASISRFFPTATPCR